MTTTTTNAGSGTDLAGLDTADGERGQRALMAERDHVALQRLVALPLWALIGIQAGWTLTLVVAGVLEQPLVATALARVLPTAPDWQIQVGAVAYLLVYAVLWHAVGHRLAEARHLSLATTSTGSSRRLNPAFGAAGVVLLIILTLALAGVAVRRALSLADRAGQTAATTLITNSVSAPSATDLAQASDRAWHDAFWPDLLFTLSLMILLAALGTWHGYRADARHHALAVQLVRRRADKSAGKASMAAAAAQDAERRVRSQEATAADRTTQAEDFTDALYQRFEQAKTTVRHALSYQQGSPEATTTLSTHHAPRPTEDPACL